MLDPNAVVVVHNVPGRVHELNAPLAKVVEHVLVQKLPLPRLGEQKDLVYVNRGTPFVKVEHEGPHLKVLVGILDAKDVVHVVLFVWLFQVDVHAVVDAGGVGVLARRKQISVHVGVKQVGDVA